MKKGEWKNVKKETNVFRYINEYDDVGSRMRR